MDEDHIAARLTAIERSISGLPSATSVGNIRNSVDKLREAFRKDLEKLNASVTESRNLQKDLRSDLDGRSTKKGRPFWRPWIRVEQFRRGQTARNCIVLPLRR